VHLAGPTVHPNGRWMAQQARNVPMLFAEQPDKPRLLLRDHDTKFTRVFDEILQAEGVEVKAVGPRAPNMNAVAERWVQSVKRECLDHFVVFGEAHLRHIVQEYLTWYHRCRPHQGLGNRPPAGPEPPASGGAFSADHIVCDGRLGGLLKHYHRRAA
jgi:putative transposase